MTYAITLNPNLCAAQSMAKHVAAAMTEALVAGSPVLAGPFAVGSGVGGVSGGGGKDASAVPAASGVGKREDAEEMAAPKGQELQDKAAQPGGGGEDAMMRDARDAAASLPPSANIAEPTEAAGTEEAEVSSSPPTAQTGAADAK